MIHPMDEVVDSPELVGLHMKVLDDHLPVWWLEVPPHGIDKNDVQSMIEEIKYIRESLEEFYARI